MGDADNLLDRVKEELGEPSAAYGLGPARFRAKLIAGLALLIGGVVLNVALIWAGVAKFAGLFAKFLFLIPISGVVLLWNLYKTRGLHVLLYPTGLLRFQRGEVESFPWGEIESIRLKADSGTVILFRDESGGVGDCYVSVEAPFLQFWKAGLTVARTDGATAKLTPAVTGYADMVERVQQATFAERYAQALAKLRAGETIIFGPFEVTIGGLRHGKNLVPWADVVSIAIENKHVTVKREGKWLVWGKCDLELLPNPHVFFALVDEARRQAVAAVPVLRKPAKVREEE